MHLLGSHAPDDHLETGSVETEQARPGAAPDEEGRQWVPTTFFSPCSLQVAVVNKFRFGGKEKEGARDHSGVTVVELDKPCDLYPTVSFL